MRNKCTPVFVCVSGIVIMYALYISHENILRVPAIKYHEVDGTALRRNSSVVSSQETTVLRGPPLKVLKCTFELP